MINFVKRDVIVDLTGKVAIVTGGRIKIGFYVARQLLKCGAKVIVTTRFAYDALSRYKKEPDYDKWKDSLEIYQINFLQLNEVYKFVRDIKCKYSKINYLINNAAQTIRRPKEFYNNIRNIVETDSNNNIKKIYCDFFKHYGSIQKYLDGKCASKIKLIENENNDEDDMDLTKYEEHKYFPTDKVDEHDQQIDLRPINSWIKTISDIDPFECFEVYFVNAIVPFYMIGELKQHMTTDDYSWIINVSSMEGSFSRRFKTHTHPHTNMAKAALNMITRTCAKEFIENKIVMVSVDTGWNTVEEPNSYHLKSPIDCIDGAARILDPIFKKLTNSGVFYKNYKEVNW